METPTTLAGGAVLILFGGALLLWCAVELRLRHRLRRHGVAATARVVADGDPFGSDHDDTFGELDSAPLLAYTAVHASAGGGRLSGAGGRELHAVEDEGRPSESVLARPRGHTPLRRPLHLVPGTLVQVAYDPRRPRRVVLAAHEDVPTLPADLFWALLGIAALAGGLTLLGAALR
ncbi:DUF3592 domain-containing protein [Kitasatospora cinereorecta]|uniref:DUF3592 domain-containing protein n=1 Tax=Kitasatospora cinereorecta TaxID=285560 RepID=UPI0031F7F672